MCLEVEYNKTELKAFRKAFLELEEINAHSENDLLVARATKDKAFIKAFTCIQKQNLKRNYSQPDLVDLSYNIFKDMKKQYPNLLEAIAR